MTAAEMEKELLALQEQHRWSHNDTSAQADISRRYRALHAEWMRAKGQKQ